MLTELDSRYDTSWIIQYLPVSDFGIIPNRDDTKNWIGNGEGGCYMTKLSFLCELV